MLDIRTIFISYAVSNAISLLVVIYLWHENKKNAPAITYWLVDYICQFFGLIIVLLRGSIPEIASVMISSGLIMGGTFVLLYGLAKYLKRTISVPVNAVIFLLFLFIQGYFILIQPSLQIRNINYSVALSIVSVEVIFLFAANRKNPPEEKPSFLIGAIFIGYLIFSLFRIVIDLIIVPGQSLFSSGSYDALVILIYQMLYIALTFSLFLLINQNANLALEKDIEIRKENEQKLQISQNKLGIVFQNIPEAIVVTNLETGEIIEVNASFYTYTGYEPGEAVGKRTVDISLWKNAGDRNVAIEILSKQGLLRDFQADFLTKSGETLHGSVSMEIIDLPEGKCILTVFRDVTRQKMVEHQLDHMASFPRLNPNPVLELNSTGEIIYSNEGSLKVLADCKLSDLEHFIPTDMNEIIQNQDPSSSGEYHREVFLSSRIFSESIQYSKELQTFRIYASDITQQYLSEKLLRETGNYLSALIENANSPIITWDKDEKITLFNRAFEKSSGYTEKEVLGESIYMLFPEGDREQIARTLAQAQSGANLDTVEIPILTKDRKVKILLWNSARILNASGASEIATIAQGQDITQRIETEKKLADNLQALNESQQISHQGNWIWYPATGEFIASPEAYRIFELPLEEDHHSIEPFLERLALEDRGRFMAMINQGSPFLLRSIEFSIQIPGRNPRYIWAKVGNTMMDDLAGMQKCTGIFQDLSDQKAVEEELRRIKNDLERLLAESEHSRRVLLSIMEDKQRAKEEIRQLNLTLEQKVKDRTEKLERSNKELESFAYSISHDLRTPLRAIDGFTRILQQDYAQALDDEGKRIMEIIRQNTKKMDQLILDILALSRVSRNQISMVKINMVEMVTAIIEELNLKENHPHLELEITPLPEADGDPVLLKQVWVNLITNAVKYSRNANPQKVIISGSDQDGVCCYSVKDNGVGFNPKYQDKLFNIFQRLHKESEFEGTGVGLAIVKRIIQRHAGSVQAESEPGHGATFSFSIPKEGDIYETS